MNKAAERRRKRERHETGKVIKLYEKFMEAKWPDYSIEWDVLGFTSWDHKCVALATSRLADDPWTVIHELVHVRWPKLPHGKRFDGIVRRIFMRAKKEMKWPNKKK